jgi:hypothetical protein
MVDDCCFHIIFGLKMTLMFLTEVRLTTLLLYLSILPGYHALQALLGSSRMLSPVLTFVCLVY